MTASMNEQLLRFAASLERSSEHPLARRSFRALASVAWSLLMRRRFNSVTGKGVVGEVDGHRVALGNRVAAG